MMQKLKMTSGLRREISFIAITWNQGQTVHAERRNFSFPTEVHRRYQNNTYESGERTKNSEVCRTSRDPGWHCKRRLWSLCSLCWTGLICVPNDCRRLHRQGADAVSAYTQVRMEDAPRLLKIPKSECPDIWIRLPRHKWPSSWSNIEDPVVPLDRFFYGHPTDWSLVGNTVRGSSVGTWWEKSELGNACLVTENKDYSSGFSWMTLKWNQLHVLITFVWDAVNVNVNRTKFLLRTTKICSKHVFLLEQLQNYQSGRNLTQRRLRGPTIWEDMLKKCVVICSELANKKTEQLYKVSSPCLDGHHFKKEELESVGELSKVCSQIVFKCLYLARTGRPDILWSVNKFARAVTKMDQGLWQTFGAFDHLHSSHMWI